MFAWLRAASSSSSAAAAAAADAAAQLQTTAADVSHTFRHGPMGLKLYTPPVFACYPPSHAALSLLCVADSHGHFPDVACTPPCDVLLVPGDFTLTGSEAEVLYIRTCNRPQPNPLPQVLQFYAWATACQWRYCVLVPGCCELRAGLTPQRLQVREGRSDACRYRRC